MKRTSIIGRIASTMHKLYPDAKVYLYGSEARGEAHADSDIDLLILVDKSNISLQDRLSMRSPLYDIELDTGVTISPYFETISRWGSYRTEFTENVNREKFLL